MAVRSNDVLSRDIAPFEVAKAVTASLWKHSFIKDTFVRNRGVFEKYQRSVIGDMAKLSIKSWLEENGFEVIDWDDIRTSWRSQRKDFDLQVNGHNIEIASSIPKEEYNNIRDVLREENIIQPIRNLKEIVVQAIFPNNRCNTLWICGWTFGQHLSNQRYRRPVRVGPRLVDFFFMPFTDRQACPMRALLQHL